MRFVLGLILTAVLSTTTLAQDEDIPIEKFEPKNSYGWAKPISMNEYINRPEGSELTAVEQMDNVIKYYKNDLKNFFDVEYQKKITGKHFMHDPQWYFDRTTWQASNLVKEISLWQQYNARRDLVKQLFDIATVYGILHKHLSKVLEKRGPVYEV